MPQIILVHGLWMNGVEMMLLRYRLRRLGYQVTQFSYRSRGQTLLQNAARLNKLADTVSQVQCQQAGNRHDALHFVAHSLGGLLVRQLFHNYPQQCFGRVVTLGTPHQGSVVVRRLSRYRLWRPLFGESLHGLLGDVPSWHSNHEIGVLAGSLSVGVGSIIFRLPRPNDGAVVLAETPLDGMTDYKVLHVSHMSMLILPIIATEIHQFLSTGSFLRQSSRSIQKP
ncbi:MAG: alpha/beta hydrolase [Gammaproteobacteria bacterium]|nr:alpha/beta hydrolase [Gammaproteobacteria bacterium]